MCPAKITLLAYNGLNYFIISPNKQFAAIMPNREGKRKIVLATSIAETSLTVEGVKVVVNQKLKLELLLLLNTEMGNAEGVILK